MTKPFTKDQYKVIKSSIINSDIIIKAADKGSAIVIVDKLAYIQEGDK